MQSCNAETLTVISLGRLADNANVIWRATNDTLQMVFRVFPLQREMVRFGAKT
jgi:hypothetical protein